MFHNKINNGGPYLYNFVNCQAMINILIFIWNKKKRFLLTHQAQCLEEDLCQEVEAHIDTDQIDLEEIGLMHTSIQFLFNNNLEVYWRWVLEELQETPNLLKYNFWLTGHWGRVAIICLLDPTLNNNCKKHFL